MVLVNLTLFSEAREERTIRENIIKADLVEGIVALPDKLFYSTSIPVSLWFLSRDKAQKGKILFVDAQNLGEMVSKRLRELTEDDIRRIANAFRTFREGSLMEEKGFCAVRTLADVKEQDYLLTPGRYVGIAESKDDEEPFEEKMERLTSELRSLLEESHRLEEEIKKLLGHIGVDL